MRELLNVLEGVRKSDNGWRAKCPCHDDSNPSLDLEVGGDGKILVICRAGCSQQAVVDFFRWRGVWPKSNGLMPRQTVPVSKPELTPIPRETITGLHNNLNSAQRAYLKTHRGISEEVIDGHRLGFKDGRVSIPIQARDGSYADCRLWRPPERRREGDPKILHYETGRGMARLFPIDQLSSQDLVLCEGEMDTQADSNNPVRDAVRAGARSLARNRAFLGWKPSTVPGQGFSWLAVPVG